MILLIAQAFAELIRLLEDRITQDSDLAKQILILQQVHHMNLKIDPKKCQLGLPIKWLRLELSNEGIQPAK